MNNKFKTILILSLILNLSIFYVAYKAYTYRKYINYYLEKYIKLSEEFSCRLSYQDANLKLKETIPEKGRVVFFGTQVVEKWNLSKYFSDYEAVNRGVTGQRAAGYLLRFRPDVIELNPKAVVLELSSYNFRPENSVKELEDYTASMAELARYHNIVPIMTTIIPPRESFLGAEVIDNYEIKDSLKVFNDWLRDFVRENDYRLVDFNGLLANEKGYLREDLSDNLVEPNDRGYELISGEINKILGEITETKE